MLAFPFDLLPCVDQFSHWQIVKLNASRKVDTSIFFLVAVRATRHFNSVAALDVANRRQ